MTLGKHPLSLHAFSLVHFFERFSYYGILSILLLFLTQKLGFSDARSYAILGVYGTLTYATPLLGGYIADKFIGFYASLWIGLSLILLGHLSIFSFQNDFGLFLGLGLVVTGSGFYKSNMNGLIGNLYKHNKILKDSGYTIFYVYQNAGSFLAPVICGYVGLKIGWSYGFSLAGFGGIFALITLFFTSNVKRLFDTQSVKLKLKWYNVLLLIGGGGILAALLSFVIYKGEETLDLLLLLSLIYFAIFLKHYVSLPYKQKGNMLVIAFGIIAVALSGALINHGGTVFTLFMSRNIDPALLNFNVPVTFIQAVDPLTVVVLGPAIAILWKYFSGKKKHIPGVFKVLFGFLLIVISYIYLLSLCYWGEENGLISVIPFTIALVLLAASDIFIYPSVLTFCSRLTPPGLSGIVMGFIVFGMSLSQLIGAYLAKLSAASSLEKVDKNSSLEVYKGFFSTVTILSLSILIMSSLCVWQIYKKKNKYGS